MNSHGLQDITEDLGEYATHRLIKGHYFLSLPHKLLEAIEREVGRDQFDDGTWEMERHVSRVVGDHSFSAGLFDGSLVSYNLLDDPAPPQDKFPESVVRETIGGGRPIEATVLGLEEAHEQLEQTHLHQCAYCGWLLTNKLFVKCREK